MNDHHQKRLAGLFYEFLSSLESSKPGFFQLDEDEQLLVAENLVPGELPAKAACTALATLQQVTAEFEVVLGSGAQGVVFKTVEASGLERAVKVLAPDHQFNEQHLRQRIDALQTGEAWGQPRFGRWESKCGALKGVTLPYLDMAYAKWSFADWKASTPDAAVRQRIATELVQALDVPNLGHFDLKPGNLRVDANGHLRIVDIGSSAFFGAANSTQAPGTAGYAAPEQVAPTTTPLTSETDNFALGLLLFEVFTLKPLWQPTSKTQSPRDEWRSFLEKGLETRLWTIDSDLVGALNDATAARTLTNSILSLCSKSPHNRKLSRADLLATLETLKLSAGSAPGGAPQAANPRTHRLHYFLTEAEKADLLGRALDTTRATILLRNVFVQLRLGHGGRLSEALEPGEDPDSGKNARARWSFDSKTPFSAACAKTPFLLVRGKPGSGKSTLAKFLTQALARRELKYADRTDLEKELEGWPAIEPVLVPLRSTDWSDKREAQVDHRDALTVVEKWVGARKKGEPERGFADDELLDKLKAGSAVLILDGLDEIEDEAQRRCAAKAIADLAREVNSDDAAHVRLLVTSRPAAFETKNPPEFGELFQTADVVELEQADIHTFVEGWYACAYGGARAEDLKHSNDAKDRAWRLLSALRADPELNRLARTPLFLTMLVLVHHLHGALPSQRVTLYEQVIDALLRRYAKAPWKPRRVRELLSKLAWRTFHDAPSSKQSARETTATWVQEFIDAEFAGQPAGSGEEFLADHLKRAGVLDAPEQRTEKFVHRSIREYLAARYLANLEESALLKHFETWVADLQTRDRSKARRASSQREVWSMLAGIVASRGSAPTQRLVKALLARTDSSKRKVPLDRRKERVTVAIHMLGDIEGFDPLPSVSAELAEDHAAMLSALESPKTPFETRLAYGTAFGLFGDPRLRPGQNESSPYSEWVTIEPGAVSFQLSDGDYEQDAFGAAPEMHSISVSQRFELRRWPITVDEYRAFVDDGGYEDERWWSLEEQAELDWGPTKDRYPSWAEWLDVNWLQDVLAQTTTYHNTWEWLRGTRRVGPAEWEHQLVGPRNVPVTGVTWWEARAFCRWRTRREQLMGSNYVVRLPSEGQWLLAARESTQRDWPWGDSSPHDKFSDLASHRANFWQLSRARSTAALTPVGIFPGGHTPSGVWDLGGNAWEWCDTHWDVRAPSARQRNSWIRRWRVVRGSSFKSAGFETLSIRPKFIPLVSSDDIGFRPARVTT
jgi:formylglycine-generating enzyme required for sulfatase activity/energy-coupling factor transporter ATP-binding protein EcfA2